MERTMLIMQGLPGLGKSRLAERIASSDAFALISTDSIRLELTGDASDLSRDMEVYQLARERAKIALRAQPSINIVVDATNTRRSALNEWLGIAQLYRMAVRVAMFDIDLTLSMAVNRKRARRGERFVPNNVLMAMETRLKDFDWSEIDGYVDVKAKDGYTWRIFYASNAKI